MSLLLAGGTILLPDGTLAAADVVCDGGRFASIVPSGGPIRGADEVVDVRGLHLLPGVIDPHVHTRDPGGTNKEDLEHASQAAAAGGVTTMFEMPNTIPPARDPATITARGPEHASRAVVDVGLWALVLGPEGRDTLSGLRQAGAVAGKLFWGYAFDRRTGALVYDPARVPAEHLLPPADSGLVRTLFREAAAASFLLGIHCEDPAILAAAGDGPAGDYEALLRARPVEAEAASVAVAIELARATGARIHILHVSSARAIELVRRGKQDGVRVTAETCPHYLTLTAADYEAAGTALKMFPPVRREEDRRALLAAVEDGTVDSIGSDHAPHSVDERSGPFASQPAGAIGIETMVPVLLDRVAAGELSLGALSRALSARTAEIYGVDERKGRIKAGVDADITVVDLSARWRIDSHRLHSKTRSSAWDGRSVTGRPVMTVVRGRVVMRDGELLPSTGEFIRSS